MIQILDEYIKSNHNENYKQLIIVAEPKMLGHIRTLLPQNLRHILEKECAKNLIGHEWSVIEKNIF